MQEQWRDFSMRSDVVLYGYPCSFPFFDAACAHGSPARDWDVETALVIPVAEQKNIVAVSTEGRTNVRFGSEIPVSSVSRECLTIPKPVIHQRLTIRLDLAK
jgi:hypothetical protein